ncbi:hypothetical protein [Paenibacillus aestuarii]|uniref:Multi-tm2 domain protein n=1 Tax=Paenibacillus aestuarii TaxID=516965 RepID=A0ABW0KET6_9BACL|nr:hypothetical protein [Paenibacillus aestuarii]
MNYSNNVQHKSRLLALMLSIIPGMGHLYMHRTTRFLVYAGGCFGALFLFIIGVAAQLPKEPLLLLALFGGLMWLANGIDMIMFLLRLQPYHPHSAQPYGQEYPYLPSDMPRPPDQPYWEAAPTATSSWAQQRERTRVILLSFVPGLGHYQLGMMQRGLTAMIAFFGVAILVFFITVLTHNEGFIAFLLALPVLWFYTMFDALKQLQVKQSGLEPIDNSIFDDFHLSDDYGRKNRTLATIIAIFPGAAHLYLNMNKRGIQLMASFLFAVYVLDMMRLSFFLFLIPLLWFYSFFDALQSIAKYENGTLTDKPLIENWTAHNKTIGILLVILGGYYAFKQIIMQLLYEFFPQSNYIHLVSNFGQTVIVALILIGAGFKLLLYRKKNLSYLE